MTFYDDESSTEDSEPREYYDITLGTTVYRLTSATRDLVISGQRYTVEAISRGKIAPAQLRGGSQAALTIVLRVNHPIVRRWYQQATPPKVATVVVWRQQVRSGVVQRIWTGNIASIDAERSQSAAIATLTVTSMLGPVVRKHLPTLTAGRQCSHVLYDNGCRLSRTGSNPDGVPYKCTATVTYVNGREIRFNLSNVPADYLHRPTWLQFGEIVHVASGERMTIMLQADTNPGVSTVTQVQMQSLIVGLKVGDAIESYAGCAHDVITCNTKFGNQINYGGFPSLPTRNPFFPTGLGVMEQT